MACIGCENYAKRVSNAYRDEELKEQFESVIGYEITSDSFICDDCLAKLQNFVSFRDQCRKIHEKSHPNAKRNIELRLTDLPAENIIVEDIDQTSQEEEQTYIEETFQIVEPEPSPKRQSRGRKSKTDAVTVEADDVMIFGSNDDNETILFEISDSPNEDGKSKIPRKSWTVAQKLDIVAYAESTSNRQAARHYNLNESTVRCFRRQKDTLRTMKPTKSTNRHGVAYWPELENTLKDWVNAQKSKPKIHEIQKEACDLAKSMGCVNFSGSTSYIFKFMQRNGINSSSPRPRKNLKAGSMDESME